MAVRRASGLAAGLLATALDGVPHGVLVLDDHRHIRAASDSFERAFRLHPGEILGLRLDEIEVCAPVRAGICRCGELAGCGTCEARDLERVVLEEGRPARVQATFSTVVGGAERTFELCVSGIPFRSDGRAFAILLFEDLERKAGALLEPGGEPRFHGLVGRHPRMVELYAAIRSVGPTGAPVLIEGESGTGKELVAQALHLESQRRQAPMVSFNCGALAESLLESELFGHVRGAFTGAIRDKKGRFELAHNGTLFLDEVSELRPATQVKLLRVLQEGTLWRVGSEHPVHVSVRVLCASNRALAAEVQQERFRSDLYYRLNVFPLRVPALRERVSDIPLLADHLLRRAIQESQVPAAAPTEELLEVLQEHAWPGNVRELDNALRYAAIKSGGAPIQPRHLPPHLARGERRKPASIRPFSVVPRGQHRLSREAVVQALETAGGSKKKAAKVLGVGRSTLYRHLTDLADEEQPG